VARRRRVPDGQGGWSLTYYSINSIDGRLRPATSRERETALKEERFITHVFYCVANENIARGDMLSPGVLSIDGSEISSTDILVEIDAVREPSTADEHWEIDCNERQPSISDIAFFRILEDGDFRILEDGDFLLLE
jgi:hypothetical protein